ncbi:MAG: zinc ABC transporter substrate-binding protein [Mollicutes bacterium]|nr:zinc ABC transporter substrate-binding protein [Mollicutes bacterium]
MKKLKIFILLIFIISLTGCFKKDTLEDITIYTTNYPTEYITKYLYSDNADILSIYPNNVDIMKYKLNDKQIDDYSKADIFIYNGLSNEKEYAIQMLNKNKQLLIIDSTISMEYETDSEELWIDLSNFLMIAQNIKNGFNEYITSTYLKKDIEEKYEQLKVEISELDAEIKLLISNSSNKTLVVGNDIFLYLKKYGINVISLEENDNLTDKIISDVNKMISKKQINYIYLKSEKDLNATINKLVESGKIEIIYLHSLSNLSDEDRIEKLDYLQIMNNNVDKLKRELYK